MLPGQRDIMSTQTEKVLEGVEHVPEPNYANAENQPLVPFPSDLRLTRDQEEGLIGHAVARVKSIEQEMGRNQCGHSDWWQDAENVEAAAKTWMAKREMYEATFHNDVEWRARILGGIFAESNLVVPLARRITRQMVARANNYFFATDPWVSAKPERGRGSHNEELADKVDKFAKFKLEESRSKRGKENAIELAFIRGECVLKSVYRSRVDRFMTTADVLINVQGEPIRDSSGGHVFKNDRWTPLTVEDPETGEVMRDETVIVLERDPSVRQPRQMFWAPERIEQTITHFQGAECGPVYFKDFLCPLTAESVDKADIVAHVYDMPLMDLAESYSKRAVLSKEEKDRRESETEWESVIRAIDLLRELSHDDSKPKAAKDQTARSNEEEGQMYPTDEAEQDPVIEVAECYLTYDADGDGIRENIMLVYDRKTRRPIFYDYLGNITPDGMRPFSVIRPTEVDGRWYGVGAMEMFESTQNIVDLLVNRWNFAMGKSGRVTFWNPEGVTEGDRNPHLKLNDGSTYTLKKGWKAEDVLQYVALPEIKHEAIQNMFEFFLQMAMNESGVQHANDANAVGLDQAKLATGIRNIEKSGMEMFSSYLSKLEPGVQDALAKEINLIFANLAEEEVFEFFGEDGSEELLTITPEEVRDLPMRVSVLLTRYRGEQMVQQATAAIDAVDSFYAKDPMVQQRTAPLYQMFIKGLDIRVDAQQIFQPLPLQAAPTGGAGVNPTQAGQAAKPAPSGQPQPNL